MAARGPFTRSMRRGADIDFDIAEDQPTATIPPPTSVDPCSVLGEVHDKLNHLSEDSTDYLASQLEKFHIYSPAKKNVKEASPNKVRGRKRRPEIQKDTFAQDERLTSTEAEIASSPQVIQSSIKRDSLALALQALPSNQEQLAKHDAGHFEWIITLPASDRANTTRPGHQNSETEGEPSKEIKKLHLGCNLVRRSDLPEQGASAHPRAANRYTFIATPIENPEDSEHSEDLGVPTIPSAQTQGDFPPRRRRGEFATPEIMTVSATDRGQVRRTSEVILSGKKNDIAEQIISLPQMNTTSRIEDSVEALDELEEQLEAVDEAAQLERALSAEAAKNTSRATKSDTSANTAIKRSATGNDKSAPRVRQSMAAGCLAENQRPSVKTSPAKASIGEQKPAAKPSPARTQASRPASLLPPKPLAKSSRPPTYPTFELPGAAVAQRLKEKREARLSTQVAGEPAKTSPSKSRARAPTVPTFELPGEAISRRKREEKERRLKEQAEQERQRREFKARPMPGQGPRSNTTASYPRETIASRARQALKTADTAAGGSPGKRHSLAVLPVRGRGSTVGSASTAPQATSSRATSSSTGSGSRVSAEDMQQQRARGREIYSRDSSLAVSRERERRDREAAARIARQEAAERSRALSREWAEKQRLKQQAAAGAGAAAH